MSVVLKRRALIAMIVAILGVAAIPAVSSSAHGKASRAVRDEGA